MNTIVAPSVKKLQITPPPSAPLQERIGARLAQARQSQGLSETTVANKLHLSVSVIQALEQDQFEQIAGPVFVRGYIKKYAHFLGIDVQDLPPLPELGPPRDLAPTAVPLGGPNREISSNHVLVQVVTWSIVLGLLALVALWWQGQFAWEDKSVESSPPTTIEPITTPKAARPPNIAVTPSKKPQAEKAATTIPPNAVPASAQPTPTQAPPPSVAPLPAPPLPQPAVMQEHQAVAEKTDASSQADAVAPKPALKPDAPAVAAPKVTLAFAGTCWMDIRDSKRTFRMAGKMRKGDKRTLQGGTPPYTVVLGNSSDVTVTVNGKPFDIAPHSRGGVARFVFDPSAIDR